MTIRSWGGNPKAKHKTVLSPSWRNSITSSYLQGPVLPVGLLRSYGDSCLNDGGNLVNMRMLNRVISFNRETGIIRAEAGISLAEMLNVIVPAGWFLPVTPGTKFVTLGGAVANDIHGKNQTKDGTFGRYVRSITLMRSDGSILECNPSENSELFYATIAGMGLTGMMITVEVQLKKVSGPYIDNETITYEGLDEFLSISDESEKDYLYTVAWIDCMGKGSRFARGVFFRGNHSLKPGSHKESQSKKILITAPFLCPNWTLNRLSLSMFNESYYTMNRITKGTKTIHYDPFFYPLDAVGDWNKVYGSRGFFQFQCVVPRDDSSAVIGEVLKTIVDSKQPSFLGVLKCFGDIISQGIMSFPRPGITLALDFPNRGDDTRNLMKRLHKIVFESKGAVYPAKDAWMSPQEFTQYYPNLEKFKAHVDPAFSSSFWQRVTQTK